jgi:hypothetical protein
LLPLELKTSACVWVEASARSAGSSNSAFASSRREHWKESDTAFILDQNIGVMP